MNRILITAAIAAATLAAPALANDQLARSAGVEPGVYSTTELAALRQAREDGDHLRYRTILERAQDGFGGDAVTRGSAAAFGPSASASASASGAAAGGRERLAATLGVDPDDHTMAELTAMYFDATD